MSILASEIVTAVEYRIGGPVSTALGGTLGAVNRACALFYNMHSWRTALVAEALLDLTASDESASLPSNFASLMGVSRTDGGFIERTTLTKLMEMRRAGQSMTGAVTMCAVDGLQFLQLYPIPGASETDAISITYGTRFVALEATDEVGVADFIEPFLIECCVSYAAGIESGTALANWQAITESALFEQAKRMDGAGSPIIDRGGMPMPVGETDAFWTYGGITP
jgi:hypothetical protein